MGSRLGRAYPNNALTWRIPATAVNYDASGGGNSALLNSSGTNTITWTHTAAGPVLAFVNAGTHATPTITVTYGGVSMTQLGIAGSFYSVSGSMYSLAVFGLMNPASGPQTVSAAVNSTTNSRIVGDTVSYSNVAAFGTAAVTTGTGTSLTQSVSSARAQMVAQAFGAAAGTAITLSAYNQTSRYSGSSGSFNPLLIGDAPGNPSVSFSATLSASDPWASIAVPLTPIWS